MKISDNSNSFLIIIFLPNKQKASHAIDWERIELKYGVHTE